MFILVKLLNGFSRPLWYKVPQDWDSQNLLGSLVKVPVRKKYFSAIVIDSKDLIDSNLSFHVRDVSQIETIPSDPHYLNFLNKLSNYYQVDTTHFVKRMRHFLSTSFKETVSNLTFMGNADESKNQILMLTNEQQAVCDYLMPQILNGNFAPTLLHGVTGSGKTEVYKKLILYATRQKKTALLLLPEVSLANNFQRILKSQLPEDITIFGFHSSTGAKEKKELWKALLEARPIVIVGVHLPILLPLPNLGLIIVDEEHDAGFQEKKHPRINSKEAAIWRAQLHKIPILLGSATPSISSLYNAKNRGWKLFQITKRFSGAFPKVEIVSLSDKKQRRNFWISTQLEHAIKDRLQKKEQIILFLNRRGYSFFVQCKLCGAIFSCPSCSVSLTLHADERIHCHYCSYSMPRPNSCASCNASEKDLLKKGIGTQQISDIVQKMFPTACIARADLDVTINKKKWQQTIENFAERKIDIMIGTQTITKGYHFPGVTLVGILWADIHLHFPRYNASEVTLQQIIQVAGRAGRNNQSSTVIIQTLSDHAIFNYTSEVDYLNFYQEEILSRESAAYPPCSRLSEIELKYEDEAVLEQESQLLAKALLSSAQEKKYLVTILGPAKPPVYKIKNIYLRKIFLKSNNINQMIQLFEICKKLPLKSSIFFTPNPLN